MRLALLVISLIFPVLSSGQMLAKYNAANDKVIISTNSGIFHLTPLTENAIRVQYGKAFENNSPEFVFTSKHPVPEFELSENDTIIRIILAQLTTTFNKKTGILTYQDSLGKNILQEKPGSRIYKESSVQGKACYIVGQSFESPSDEYLFGTGQFQDGYLNSKGLTRRLTQVNTQIAIPFIMSSKGYGLLWHNYGLTDYNPADSLVHLSTVKVNDKIEKVDITTTEGTKSEVRQESIFSGTFDVSESGKYAVLLDVGQSMARRWQLEIDGSEIINFKNFWLPPTTSTFVYLEPGKHEVRVVGEKSDSPSLYYRKVANETVFRSPNANLLDYVIFAGNADEVISSYRELTGKAPLMPKWAMGYIHCRERFHSQSELLENAREFRKRQIPVDIIVQDWQYWGKHGWNAMKFDEDLYPDPALMVKELHSMGMHFMLSVWSKVDENSSLGKEFSKKGFYIPNTSWIDFFNTEAADFYWNNFNRMLIKPYGIDAWWQDATEPENDDLKGRMVNNGTIPGEMVRNVYPLTVTKTVYEGSRRDVPDKRVFILTRSGFSGQQRYAAAVWSGDVGNDFETLRRQITAGLNLSITGIPWWTFDAGGFFRPGEGQYSDPEFQERFLRWFQFSTFCPLQRVHGYQTNTEFWRYGEELEKEALKYLNLRYQLLPYIYSLAADITFNHGTIMRPLVMDFPDDKQALEQSYEYMFGPAVLVAPVVEKDVKEWNVYLPKESGWFNFWTGEHFEGGQTIATEAGLSTIPLFIKEGSIIPIGQPMQYTSEKPNDTIEVRVYPGADGKFELYEDEGINYNYENGAYSLISFTWDQDLNTLSIGERVGSFNGILPKRVFNIVFVNGKGISNHEVALNYSGLKINIKGKF